MKRENKIESTVNDLDTMEEFIQELRRAARGSKYKKRLLVEEFKREINRAIRRKLMKTEY